MKSRAGSCSAQAIHPYSSLSLQGRHSPNPCLRIPKGSLEIHSIQQSKTWASSP